MRGILAADVFSHDMRQQTLCRTAATPKILNRDAVYGPLLGTIDVSKVTGSDSFRILLRSKCNSFIRTLLPVRMENIGNR